MMIQRKGLMTHRQTVKAKKRNQVKPRWAQPETGIGHQPTD